MMPVYNKIKTAILALVTSTSAYAFTLDPIEVQSDAGNLFYAEIKFKNADPNSRIEAGLAESQDLVSLGIAHQTPSSHLNFFTRKSGDGSGVIVITSLRPLLESELDILIKIKEGNATYIQQIKTALKPSLKSEKTQLTHRENALIPQSIVSEKDIALNLAMSSQYQPGTNPPAQALHSAGSNSINVAALSATTVSAVSQQAEAIPAVATSTQHVSDQSDSRPSIAAAQSSAATLSISETIRSSSTVGITTQTAPEQPAVEQAQAQAAQSPENPAQAQTKATAQSKAKLKANSVKQNTTAPKRVNSDHKSHIVQSNESLWAISAKVAAQNNQSIPQVMQQIKNNNEHAFIAGNANRIRRGAALNISSAAQQKPSKAHPNTQVKTKTNRAQSAKEKYKLNQAEMKLLAEHKQDSAQGASKEQSYKNQSSPELVSQVIQVRETTVKLQHNVSQLKLGIQKKDQRIQLLNTRLAELQQQLQQNLRAAKSAHKTN